MDLQKKPEIFFHVGLGRTATTFMQRSVFPKFKNIYYINKHHYRKADQIIAATQQDKYLISHEFSKELNKEMKQFSYKYPNAKIIIVFRRHDKWIASHYKRSLKNGFPSGFKGYFDLDKDTGFWKKEHLDYYNKLKCIDECFNHKPLVLFHQDLKDNPKKFLQQILDYIGVKETGPICIKTRHTSYGDKELKVREWVNSHTIFKEVGVKDYKLSELRRLYNKTIRYTVLNFAKIIPDSMVSDKPLIPGDELKRIRDYYKNDWEKCIKYAKENNPDISSSFGYINKKGTKFLTQSV